jgi:hypothetical protein
MSKTIFKYPITPVSEQSISVPVGAIPLHVGVDPKGSPCVWCKVDSSEQKKESLNIYIVGTGDTIPKRAQVYLGTLIIGPLVLHLFTPDKDFPL